MCDIINGGIDAYDLFVMSAADGVFMQEHMVRIELGGILGKKFGKSHCRMVATASEAIRALCCTINGFEKFMNNSKAMGLTYAVFKGKKNISADDIPFPINDKVIRIVPVVIGSKSWRTTDDIRCCIDRGRFNRHYGRWRDIRRDCRRLRVG